VAVAAPIESAPHQPSCQQTPPIRPMSERCAISARSYSWSGLVWSGLRPRAAHGHFRSLVAKAALHAGHDPDRAGFVRALRITCRSVAHQGATAPGWTTTQ